MINQLSVDMFEKIYRGRVYTLVRYDLSGGWFMWNKLVNGRSNPPKPFDSLDHVEKHYKHWVGIKQLIGAV
jgi:hypothetical protein